MSATFGRHSYAIPGPSQLPERVLNAMHRPSPNIYEGEIVDLTASILPDLRAVAGTRHNVAIYIANGHGAWEAALRNTVQPGEKVLALSTGSFGAGWGQLAKSMGIDVELLDFGMESPAQPQRLEEALRADTDNAIKAVLVVQTDTASSVRNDIASLRAAIDACGHEALLLVDCIASLGCEPYAMDEWGVDVTVSACQKGLMTPVGLSFVFFNEKAERARQGVSPGQYWDWVVRTKPDLFYQQFGGTPPTHHIYGLREALDMLVHEEGIENAWARHGHIARAVWSAVDRWGASGRIWHNIAHQQWRSTAVSTIVSKGEEAIRIRRWCEEKAGVTLGIGIGFGAYRGTEFNRRFRIGHMGYNNLQMVMGVLGAIDAAFKALDIPHAPDALNAASDVFSRGCDDAKTT